MKKLYTKNEMWTAFQHGKNDASDEEFDRYLQEIEK